MRELKLLAVYRRSIHSVRDAAIFMHSYAVNCREKQEDHEDPVEIVLHAVAEGTMNFASIGRQPLDIENVRDTANIKVSTESDGAISILSAENATSSIDLCHINECILPWSNKPTLENLGDIRVHQEIDQLTSSHGLLENQNSSSHIESKTQSFKAFSYLRGIVKYFVDSSESENKEAQIMISDFNAVTVRPRITTMPSM
jgi:hypothetical protein